MLIAAALMLALVALAALGATVFVFWMAVSWVLAHAADVMAGPDRRRHVAECSAYGSKLLHDPACRVPASVAVCEQIWALPERSHR